MVNLNYGIFVNFIFSIENLQLQYSNLNSEAELKDEDKLKLIFNALKLLSAYVQHYSNLPSSYAIWTPVLKQLDQLPVSRIYTCIRCSIRGDKNLKPLRIYLSTIRRKCCINILSVSKINETRNLRKSTVQ